MRAPEVPAAGDAERVRFVFTPSNVKTANVHVPTSDSTRRPRSARRDELLRLLEADEGDGLAITDLAPLAGLHPSTVRAHLELLVREGTVSHHPDPRRAPGRPRELYRATGAAPDDRNYALLAQMLAAELATLAPDPRSAARSAGRRWAGRGVEAADPDGGVASVIHMLRRTGFAPELSVDATAIELNHCPFRELATEHPDVVCGAHLGLIQGALERTGAPVTVTRLVPFVDPDRCVAHLAAAPPR